MILYIIFTVLVILGVGLGVQWWVNRQKSYSSITNLEFLWTSALIALLIVPAITFASWKISKNNQLSYTEQLNGWEKRAYQEVVTCRRDGACHYCYNCDPYIVMVPYTYKCGKSTCSGSRPETRYHSCPYAKEEWHHYVETTLGTYSIEGARLPDDYKTNPWRWGNAASNWVAEGNVGRPKFWLQAKSRIEADSAGPVTQFHTYENYVLASHVTTLKTAVAADIKGYLAKDSTLLPKIERKLSNQYQIDKVYSVGVPVPAGMREAVHRVSASMGFHRSGDLRVVLVSDKVGGIDQYANTLQAFWQSRDYQDSDHALPKNAVVLVLQVANGVIRESRAFTGMPTGNEALQDALSRKLRNVPFQTDTLFGFAHYRSAKSLPLDRMGLVGHIIVQSPTAFERENMGYYAYLKGDVQPSTTAKVVAVILSLILGSLAWYIPIVLHCPTEVSPFSNFRRKL